MKHITKVEEKAGLTAGATSEVEKPPVYIEDKWTLSGRLQDPLFRKRVLLGAIGVTLLIISFILGYKAGTTPPGVQTLSTPADLPASVNSLHVRSPHKKPRRGTN
ncbi:Aste57867_24748 [Aphanomyces stellatus]|uniref:Aste57867_24748 protein n=1 Tax=Aphanomyces stellatus TaxID=120398 RepID=A0A485LTC0_9STRA|nr:hypothetical protein As57867_024670 [Aphanomyces stellatus]VFU01384.1 Aste57867_24748 [Aphanomyces stellatus]